MEAGAAWGRSGRGEPHCSGQYSALAETDNDKLIWKQQFLSLDGHVVLKCYAEYHLSMHILEEWSAVYRNQSGLKMFLLIRDGVIFFFTIS